MGFAAGVAVPGSGVDAPAAVATATTGLGDGTVASGVIDAMGNPTAVGVASTCPETDGEAGSIPATVANVATIATNGLPQRRVVEPITNSRRHDSPRRPPYSPSCHVGTAKHIATSNARAFLT